MPPMVHSPQTRTLLLPFTFCMFLFPRDESGYGDAERGDGLLTVVVVGLRWREKDKEVRAVGRLTMVSSELWDLITFVRRSYTHVYIDLHI